MSRFAHQQREYDDHKYDVARAYLWQMRTGKSRMAIESAVALHEALEIGGVLVIAPNGVHRQWAEQQVPRWSKGWNTFAWSFTNLKNMREFELFLTTASWPKLAWMCVNQEVVIREDVKKAIAQFKRAVGRAMLIVDESHHFAVPGSKRTGVARGLGRRFEYRRILTGTPVENSPRQAFSQFEILEKAALGHETYKSFDAEFTKFEDGYGSHGKFQTVAGYKNLGALKQRMRRFASVVLREDCEDLPPVQRDERLVEMTANQLKWHRMIRDKALEECEESGIDRVFSGGAALVKLQQVEGGFFIHPDKRLECLGPNPKMLILLDEIQSYDSQVIVWFEYIHELEAAYAALTSAKIRCGRYHGRVPTAEREKTLSSFNTSKMKVLLAQPRAGGEGRDMSAAGKIIWYSHTPDAIVRAQADERATAMGGKSVQVVDLVAPVGRYFLDLTRDKRALADDVSRRGLREILDNL